MCLIQQFLLHMQTLSFSIASDKVHQMLNTSVSESLDTLDVVHTVVFPEGKTPDVTVEYNCPHKWFLHHYK